MHNISNAIKMTPITLHKFWINSVPTNDAICLGMKAKCAHKSKGASGKLYYCFSSSKKEITEAWNKFMKERGCEVSEPFVSEFEPENK